MMNHSGQQLSGKWLQMGLLLLVVASLAAATIFLAQFLRAGGAQSGGTIIGPDGEVIQQPGGSNGSTVDYQDLSLALASVITAVTGLLGVVGTQIWRGREEDRLTRSHQLTLERERLELERQRLEFEKERLAFEQERRTLTGGGPSR